MNCWECHPERWTGTEFLRIVEKAKPKPAAMSSSLIGKH